MLKCCFLSSIESRFNFGKYENLTLADVLDIDMMYVVWCVYQCDVYFLISDNAINQIKKAFPEFNASDNFIKHCHVRKLIFEFWESEEEESSGDFDYYGNDSYESESFERYCGSYTQDEMRYSDDDIDTIFDGNPLAYWNID